MRVDLTEQSEAHPLPLGKIRVFVFNDNAWTNGAPDTEEGRPGRLPGRAGGADRQRGHRRLQQRPALRRRLPDLERRGDPRLRRDQQPRPGHLLHRRAPAGRTPCNERSDQPLVPDHDDRRRPQPDGPDRGRRRRHRRARRAALGAAQHPHRLLVRLRLRAAALRQPRARARSPARPELGRVGAVHDRHLQRPGREPVRRALRRVDRPDRLRRPGRCRRQLRHPERPGRRLQPGHLGRTAQLHHALQARPRGRRRRRST